MGWHAVAGPREAGPSERERMLEEAERLLAADGVEDPQRIDVPAKGTGSDDASLLREPVAAIVPALQSGSLFGGTTGVIVVDAQSLLKAEVDTIAELLSDSDPDSSAAVFVASGTLPAPIKKVLTGETVAIKAITERDAASWLTAEARERGLRIDQEARTEMLHRFGSDTSAMKRALDQLSVAGKTITADDVHDRFTSRPDEPMWFLGDAIMSGDSGEALRRLADFLHHQHPLILLSYLEGEVRKRSLAAVAPDYDTFASWAKVNPNSYATKKIWQSRTRANGEALALSIKAIAKADLTLKTQPEPTHRVTLERLTVAMSRWMNT
ncbi:MAG: DNA polymerase III subunit delta [Acidimicrobiia bacterium]